MGCCSPGRQTPQSAAHLPVAEGVSQVPACCRTDEETAALLGGIECKGPGCWVAIKRSCGRSLAKRHPVDCKVNRAAGLPDTQCTLLYSTNVFWYHCRLLGSWRLQLGRQPYRTADTE